MFWCYILSCLKPSKYYYELHFTDVETEAQGGKLVHPGTLSVSWGKSNWLQSALPRSNCGQVPSSLHSQHKEMTQWLITKGPFRAGFLTLWPEDLSKVTQRQRNGSSWHPGFLTLLDPLVHMHLFPEHSFWHLLVAYSSDPQPWAAAQSPGEWGLVNSRRAS